MSTDKENREDKALHIGGVVVRKYDLKNALMIIGISFVLSGMILITTTVLGGVPCLVGGLMFGYGAGIKWLCTTNENKI